jgi:hypothetical protein
MWIHIYLCIRQYIYGVLDVLYIIYLYLIFTTRNRGTFVCDFKFVGTDEYKSNTFVGAKN